MGPERVELSCRLYKSRVLPLNDGPRENYTKNIIKREAVGAFLLTIFYSLFTV